MPTQTLFSNRIYKKTQTDASNIEALLRLHNQAKIKAYSMLAYNHELPSSDPLEPEGEKISLHMFIKELFNFNTYYANYATREGKAAYQSSKELQSLYIEEQQSRLEHLANKINKTKTQIAFHEKVLQHCIELSKDKKIAKPLHFKKFIHLSFSLLGDALYITPKNKEPMLMYLYEHQILKAKLKNLYNRLHFLKRKERYETQKLESIKLKPSLSCFGSRKLLKSKHTIYKNNPTIWRSVFEAQRFKTMCIQGVNTSKDCNFCARLDKSGTLTIKDSRNLDLNYKLTDVSFRYKKNDNNHFYELLDKGYQAVAYRIEDMGDYFIIKVSFEIESNPCNYSTSDGVVALDKNYDNFALANISADGNLLNRVIIHFDLKGKKSGQRKKILESAANEAVFIAEKYKKPLVLEDITNPSKAKLKYKDKQTNYKLSSFAHKQMDAVLASRANKKCVGIIKVNPAYTSQIGKIKYMKQKGLSIHESAAYVIGRRALECKETVPKQYKHLKVSKGKIDMTKLCHALNKVKIYKFYTIKDISHFKTAKALADELNK